MHVRGSDNLFSPNTWVDNLSYSPGRTKKKRISHSLSLSLLSLSLPPPPPCLSVCLSHSLYTYPPLTFIMFVRIFLYFYLCCLFTPFLNSLSLSLFHSFSLSLFHSFSRSLSRSLSLSFFIYFLSHTFTVFLSLPQNLFLCLLISPLPICF